MSLTTEDRERTLQDAWFRAEGVVPPPDDRIHPDDDMYRGDVLALEDVRRRAEYMRSGYEAYRVLEGLLAQTGRRLSAVPRLLDFACGYGRVNRYLARALPPRRIWASDVLRPAVEFVRSTFGVHGFDSAPDPVDVAIPGRFSLIWVGSLFSHLPRASFSAFLRRLYEALEPDGLLVFSTHSTEVLPAESHDPSGFTFVPHSESHELDPDAYGSTFVRPAVVAELAGEAGVRHLGRVERELWRIQDVYVASPAPVPGLGALRHASVVRGSIERIELDGEGHGWIGGWARFPAHENPPRELSLTVDGAHQVELLWRPFEGPLPQVEGGERFRQADWYVEGSVRELGPGFHTLCASAVLASGRRGCFDARPLVLPREGPATTAEG